MASKGGGRGSGKGGPSGMGVPSGSGGGDDRRARRAEAVAAMKREQARRQTRSRLLMAAGVVVAVAIVAGVGIYVGLTKTASPASATPRTVASATVVKDVTSVPASVFDTVGVGGAIAAPKSTGVSTPTKVGGKVRVLYVGAEYCPYCATERWAIAAALARFGTFTGLKETESGAKPEVFPKTQTLSFYGSTYSSPTVDFQSVETETNDDKPLEKLAGSALATEEKYNAAPYVPADSAGAIPFVDIGDQYVSAGATLNAQVLQGLTHEQIAADMQDPTSDVAKGVDGAANLFTAAICHSTGGQPAAVCTSSGVEAAAKVLSSGSK